MPIDRESRRLAATEPFFIIGSPRSGTTLLRLMLNNHPDLVVPPECGFVVWLREHFETWDETDFATPERLDRFITAVTQTRKFETWNLPVALMREQLLEARPAGYADACSAIYGCYATLQDKPRARWGDKNNFYLSHIPAIRAVYPRARFIHIVRDGRDVACSYREVMRLNSESRYRPELPTAAGDIARQWSGDIRTIRAALAPLPPGRSTEVRYEDLTGTPGDELSRICRWLGEAFDPGMLEFHASNRERQLEPRATMDWKRRTLEPTSTATVGRHRSEMSEEERAAFEAEASAELHLYGYDTTA